jgi:pSer/pThr/pTyr-binding forkhead associated (FHA) protein
MQVALIMFKEDGQRKEFPIDPGKTIIGRKDDCDLRIPLGEVSRKHALLIADKGVVTLRDLGSANGTYVNNIRITERELAAGDRIVIGQVVFVLQVDGQPADIRPVHTRLEARSSARTSVPPDSSGSHAGVEDQADIFNQDDDPISALEALAASDDTAAINLDDSFADEDPM